MNPKIGTQLETVKREGVDIVFAIDVSKSMLAEDIAPNRLEKAKRLVSALLNDLASDRVGIIAYAAQAVPQLPITTDYGAAKMFLQALNTDMLSSQGTAIDAAIDLASTYFDDEEQTNRVVFILSDGEDHAEDGTIDAAQRANALGIKVYGLGVGTEKGAPIPIKRNGIVESYKKDENDEVVITQRNAQVLTSIAESTNASYLDGNDTRLFWLLCARNSNKWRKKNLKQKSLWVTKTASSLFWLPDSYYFWSTSWFSKPGRSGLPSWIYLMKKKLPKWKHSAYFLCLPPVCFFASSARQKGKQLNCWWEWTPSARVFAAAEGSTARPYPSIKLTPRPNTI